MGGWMVGYGWTWLRMVEDGWGWFNGWLVGWLDGWMVGWLDGWMVVWLDVGEWVNG